MYVIRMMSQAMRPVIAVIFTSHRKTVPSFSLTFKYASNPGSADPET